MVILDELPFKSVESEGFHQFCPTLKSSLICAQNWFQSKSLDDMSEENNEVKRNR